MTTDEVVRYLRAQPCYSELVRDAYFDRDVISAAIRFEGSAEFDAIRSLLTDRLDGGVIVDLGAGSGIASFAFARAGARLVYAIEPDPSEELGRGAIQKLAAGLPIEVITGFGEELPLQENSSDIVFARQVMHHTRDLPRVMRECFRVLKPHGLLLACREHVVDGPDQLREFLSKHPTHPLTGTENAFPLERYSSAITSAGMDVLCTLGPFDSIINAFPLVRSAEQLRTLARSAARRRLGRLADLALRIPGVEALVWKRLRRPTAGRFYTFLARKP